MQRVERASAVIRSLHRGKPSRLFACLPFRATLFGLQSRFYGLINRLGLALNKMSRYPFPIFNS